MTSSPNLNVAGEVGLNEIPVTAALGLGAEPAHVMNTKVLDWDPSGRVARSVMPRLENVDPENANLRKV